MTVERFINPEVGNQVTSDYESVHQFGADVMNVLAEYRPGDVWHMCDAFSTTASGLLIPDNELMRYQRDRGWFSVAVESGFQTAYQQIRDRIIEDAQMVFGTETVAVMLQLRHSGPNPQPLDPYNQAAHVDFVSLLDQPVLAYHLSNVGTTRFFTGEHTFQGFVDDYADWPGFTDLVEKRPEQNELIRTEGITGVHAPVAESHPNRVHIRAFAEPIG